MCGIVGLFVGCAALNYCPRALLRPDPTPEGTEDDGEEPDDEGYLSPMRNWYDRSAVRSRPRRTLREDEESKLYFSPDLVPVASHPLVRRLNPEVFEQVLIQHLYRYLDFTTKLESLVVNRTVLGIAHGTVGVRLPEAMRFDAYKIYCDEAYHTLFSVDLSRQVSARTGIPPRLPAEPYFLRRLRKIQESLPDRDRPLAELLFVIVSETLISGTLGDVPDDPLVVRAVRETTRDHALDEGRHHAFFALFLRRLWGQLDPDERRRAALLVPALMDAFLRPDTAATQAELTGYGLSRDEAEQVVGEVFTTDAVRAQRVLAARQTVRYIAELGGLDSAEAAEQFDRYGLTERSESGGGHRYRP